MPPLFDLTPLNAKVDYTARPRKRISHLHSGGEGPRAQYARKLSSGSQPARAVGRQDEAAGFRFNSSGSAQMDRATFPRGVGAFIRSSRRQRRARLLPLPNARWPYQTASSGRSRYAAKVFLSAKVSDR